MNTEQASGRTWPGSGRRRLVAIGAVAIVSLLPQVATGSAGAYPNPDGSFSCEKNSNIDYEFENTGDWVGGRDAAFTDGANNWESPRRFDGTRLVDIDVVAGAAMEVEVDPGLGSGGSATCNSSGNPVRIRVSVGTAQTRPLDQVRGVGAHEMGHIIGLPHTGREDSSDGDLPTMSRCGSSAESADKRSLERDDRAAIADEFQNNSVANAHFEAGSSHWTRGSNTALSRTSSNGAANGSYYGRMTQIASGSLPTIYTVTRIVEPNKIRARFARRRGATFAVGALSLQVFTRTVNYGTGGCGGGSGGVQWDPYGHRLNDPTTPADSTSSFILRQSVVHSEGTNWQYVDNAKFSITAGEATDVRVQVQKSTISGIASAVHLDSVRVYTTN